jgi:integrase
MGVKVREYKPGAWWVLIDHKGQRKAKKIGSKKAALEAAAKIEAAIAADALDLPSPVKRPPTLFGEYAETWMTGYVRTNLKESTAQAYRVLLDKHIYPSFRKKPLAEITRNEIKALCYKKAESGLAERSVHYIARTMSTIFNQAIEDGLIAANPAARPGRYVKMADRRGKFGILTPAEGRLFLDIARERSTKFYPLFLTALRTGMRQGEILGLQWGDIDWNGKFIEIRRASWNRIITTPKNGKSRRVDMSDQLAQVLSEHKLALAKQALKKGRTMSEWVFPSSVGAPLEPNRVREAFFFTLKQAGLRRIRFHDLRHSFASWLIANGESLAYVKEQLGHHSIQITVDTYGHLVPGANRKAVNALDDLGWDKNGEMSSGQTSLAGTVQEAADDELEHATTQSVTFLH